MRPTRAITLFPLLVTALASLQACDASLDTSNVVGNWTNDDNTKSTMLIASNLTGQYTDLSSSFVEHFKLTLSTDVFNHYIIESVDPTGRDDLLCDGCAITGNHMSCDHAVANSGGVNFGYSCNWTKVSP